MPAGSGDSWGGVDQTVGGALLMLDKFEAAELDRTYGEVVLSDSETSLWARLLNLEYGWMDGWMDRWLEGFDCKADITFKGMWSKAIR